MISPTVIKLVTRIIGPIIRPILREEIAELKQFILHGQQRMQNYAKFEREADELIIAIEQASTTEEVKAHLRRLRDSRAKLNT